MRRRRRPGGAPTSGHRVQRRVGPLRLPQCCPNQRAMSTLERVPSAPACRCSQARARARGRRRAGAAATRGGRSACCSQAASPGARCRRSCANARAEPALEAARATRRAAPARWLRPPAASRRGSVALNAISIVRSRMRVGAARRVAQAPWAQHHHHHVERAGRAQQRHHRRVGAEAAIPVRLAVDLDRMVQRRQAGRGHRRVERQLVVAEHAQAAAVGVRGRDVQRDARLSAQAFEIDAARAAGRAAGSCASELACAGDIDCAQRIIHCARRRQLRAVPVSQAPRVPRHRLRPSALQNLASVARAPSRPPSSRPCTSSSAFIAPALAPLTATIGLARCSSSASSTPQVNAPCAPPPCSASPIGARCARARENIGR